MLANPVKRAVCLDAHPLEGIHLRGQPHELTDPIAAGRIQPHLPHLFYCGVGEVDRIEVDVLLRVDHVFQEIRRLDLVHEAVCVREEQMRLLAILIFADFLVKSRDR